MPVMALVAHLCLGVSQAQALETGSGQTVVVTAARVPQAAAQSFAATTVLDREAILRSGAADLPGLLATLPGVQTAQAGGPGAQASLFVRGAESRHLLLLIDGVPVGDLSFGLAKLQALGTAGIERLELSQGNLSALYGSQALGGVLQVFTRRAPAKGLQADASVRLASHGAAAVQAALDWAGGGTQAGLALSSQRSRGFDALDHAKFANTNPDRDGWRQHHLGLHWRQALGSGLSVQARAHHSAGRNQYDSQFGPAGQADESDFSVGVAQLGLAWVQGPWASELSASRSRDALQADVTAFPYFVVTNEQRLSWNLRYTLAPGHVASGGIERSVARIQSDTVYQRGVRGQTSVRAGLDGGAGRWQWQAHLRHDATSDFGEAVTGRLGLAWLPAAGWRIGTSLATGFNAPSFNDLFYPFGGNAALKPERSRSLELQLGWTGSGQAMRATMFAQRLRDLIGNDSNFNRVNIDAARNRGLELQATLLAAGLSFSPSLTVQQPENGSNHAQLPRRARVLAGLGLGGRAGPLSWQAGLRHVGKRWDNVANTRELPAYTLLDLGAQWSPSPAWTLGLNLRNATDQDQEDVWGYRSAGRELALTLQHAWR